MSSGRIELQLVGNGTIQTALGDRRKFRVVTFPAGPRGRDGAVTSVASRTGDIVLTKADVGLGNVDNTSDASKPVSTAQAAADASVASAAAADATAKAAAALASANAAAPGLAPVQSVAGKNGAVVLTLADLTDSTPAGRALAAALDATAQRVLLGLGNSATRNVGTTAGTVAAGDDARLSDARTPTAHTHAASQISDSTGAGRTILTAADATAQRTALGLGSAAVRADGDFIRDDVDQVNTATQKRTARFNLGFSDSFTTAELLALSATESARLRLAYCSDCFSSGANMTTLYGDAVFWNGYQWLTQSDCVPICADGVADNDWLRFALNKARMTAYSEMRPTCSVHGDQANSVLSITGYTSGSGASVGALQAGTDRIIQINAGPGTTSSGAFRALPIFGVNALSNTAPIRKVAAVLNYAPGLNAISNIGTDNWYWKFGIGLPVFSASATLTADEICFVMDDANALGQGATGSEFYALCRLGGTTLRWEPTSVNPTITNKFLVATWEPTGPLAREGRARLAVADDLAANLTTIVDQTGTFSAAITTLQPYLAGAKTLGTGVRQTIRRFMRCVTYRTGTGNGGVLS